MTAMTSICLSRWWELHLSHGTQVRDHAGEAAMPADDGKFGGAALE